MRIGNEGWENWESTRQTRLEGISRIRCVPTIATIHAYPSFAIAGVKEGYFFLSRLYNIDSISENLSNYNKSGK